MHRTQRNIKILKILKLLHYITLKYQLTIFNRRNKLQIRFNYFRGNVKFLESRNTARLKGSASRDSSLIIFDRNPKFPSRENLKVSDTSKIFPPVFPASDQEVFQLRGEPIESPLIPLEVLGNHL